MNSQGWDLKSLTWVAFGILLLALLWDRFPLAGLLILAAILIVVGKGLRAGTIQQPT